jgi:phosphoribosylanthranilate isomerase
MRDSLNMQDVSALLPDYMGFIFYKKSPRYVGEDFVIPNHFPATVSRVGVFVNESITVIINKVRQHALDLVQLHGDESVEFCKELNHEGISVIKVFRVDGEFDFSVTKQFDEVAEYFLFDTKGKNFGGNAQRFDWNLLTHYDQSIPFFLSGGIDLSSLAEVLQLKNLNIHAVDVNSGVEQAPAMKDVEKVSAIINKLRL